ncbi:hypothetical protein BT96DRAFT_950545 [Gymnopus androsaceus JB14]|uniref:Uncharacterized protein n=1 Tax=Gymnopus androsaceus JB14 TaxID=1447944 RepID=A0A6A4GGA9_9AGAR|nr:hypothetical protein BT96DRAFT_950545 [Gymnopus androsaceus JB14]
MVSRVQADRKQDPAQKPRGLCCNDPRECHVSFYYFRREKMPKGYEDIIWADFAPENCCFNDIRLEWDLCHDFENAIVIYSASNSSTPQQPTLTMEPLTLDNKQTAPLFDVATPELDDMASDLQEMLPLAYKLTITMDQAQVYYGMVKIDSPIITLPYRNPCNREIGILCGQERTIVENLAVPIKVLQDFFGIMNEAKTIAEIPSKIWLPLDERESLGVRKEILNGTIHYILDPQQEGPDQKLTLIIPDARIVILVALLTWINGDYSIRAIITNLVKECCQFYLEIKGPQKRNLSVSSLQMSREKEMELLP